MSKTSIFVVRVECSGAPESVLAEVYPTKAQALARCEALEREDGYDITFFDEVLVGPEGADCEFFNR